MSGGLKYSVLMSVYDGEKPEFLRESIQSMLNQTVATDDFVLICDGALRDDLNKVINEMQKKMAQKMRVFRLPENRGLGSALKFGVEKCKNELIARMDSDDLSVKDRIENQLAVFDKMDVDVVGSNVVEYDEQMQKKCGVRSVPEANVDIVKYAKRRNPMNHVTVCFRKSAVLAVGNYEQMQYFEDYYLWARMIKNGFKFYNIQKSLVKVRGGSSMIKRRGGVKYIIATARFQNALRRSGVISCFDEIMNIIVRSAVSLCPRTLRSVFYAKMLRSNDA